MITPFPGVAFGSASDGDGREDPGTRAEIHASVGAPVSWATITQVHGPGVVEARDHGHLGEADALFTSQRDLTLVVASADCLPVALIADTAVGIAHTGWPGTHLGVVASLRRALGEAGHEVRSAAIGPGIGPCCFEVGPEVAELFPGHERRTTWGTTSVDLRAAITSQLEGLEVWVAPECSRCDDRFHSHRRDRTPSRQVSLAWLSSN